MNTDRILQFCTVVETGSLARAGEILRMTPGALSRSMRKLGDEVSFMVFTQVGRNLVLTDQGKELYEQSKRMLDQFQTAVGQIRKGREKVAELRLGSYEIFTTHFMAKLLETEFTKERVLLRELTPGALEEAVLSGEIDYGITYVPMTKDGLEHLKLKSFKSVLLKKRGAFSGVPVEKLPFAIPLTKLGKNVAEIQSLDGWPISEPREVKYHFQMLETALLSCRSGLCAVYVPEFLASLVNGKSPASEKLEAVPLPRSMKGASLDLYLVKRMNTPEDGVVKKLARAIRLVLGSSTS